jgi:hypothetical protein
MRWFFRRRQNCMVCIQPVRATAHIKTNGGTFHVCHDHFIVIAEAILKGKDQ